MSFVYPELLLWILPLPLLWFALRGKEDSLKRWFSPELYEKMRVAGEGLSKEARRALLLCAAAFAIVALARPVIDRGEIEVKTEAGDLVVAFDISRSMFADDLYPNRFEMAKRKFNDLLDHMGDTRIAVVGFSSRAFLVAPLTRDYASLKYLVDHMGLGFVSLRGTDMMAPLEVTSDLLKDRKRRALLLFTDGGDSKDFSKEIAYAKAHGIRVFVYVLGTRKGGVMRLENGGVVRDSSGEVVITRLNPAVKELAEATGGVYRKFSLRSGDMKRFASEIVGRLTKERQKESRIEDREELFYYPLMAAIALYLASLFSLPVVGRDRESKRGEAL